MNAWTSFKEEIIREWTKNVRPDFDEICDKTRLQYENKVRTIIENEWEEILEWLWNKTISFWNLGSHFNLKNLNSEFHDELSKKHPHKYSESLIVSWMKNIWYLATYSSVLRNLMKYLKNEVEEKQYKETLYTIFSLIPDLREIPQVDLDLFRVNLWDKNLLSIISNRSNAEKKHVMNNVMKYLRY